MTDITTHTPIGSPTAPAPSSTVDQAKQQAAEVASTAAEQASSVASSATDQAKAVASTAVDEAKAVGAQAAAEAKDLFADATHQLKAQAAEQSDRLADAVRQVSTQLQTMAGAADAGIARDVVQQVADQAQQISTRLKDGGLERTLDDARRLARNRPGLFLLGAAAAGFVAARVARTVDTEALKDAARPTTNGSNGNGQHQLPQGNQVTLGQASTTPPASLAPAPAAPSLPAAPPARTQPPVTETYRTDTFDVPGAQR